MKLRADLGETVSVEFDESAWVPSPEPAVHRHMLDRDGGEIARATTLVRFDRESSFPSHEHGGGEEFFVLEGVFHDELGGYPSGSYLRNPIGSRHTPFTPEGCVILVKLRQFQASDDARVVIGPDEGWREVDGKAMKLLHEFAGERVTLHRLQAGECLDLPASGLGAESLVVDGSIEIDGKTCAKWSWRRSLDSAVRLSSAEGALVWLKRGHLGST